MTELLRVWDRQPQDTDKSYAAFSEFLKMPIYGDEGEKRTLKNLAAKLGYSSLKQVSKWSAEDNWSERIAAYDTYMGQKSITLVETSLEQFKTAHIARVTTQTAVLSNVVEKRLKQLLDALNAGEPVDTMDIKRLTDTVDRIDIIARRASGMPTTYSGEQGQDIDYETQTYTVGGGE